MQLLRCLLVDDEPLALALLEQYIGREGTLAVAGACRSPIHAIEHLQREPVDLLFLDVQMPVLSGVGLLRNISRRPITIFTTAYPQYAVDAYDLDAVDYLLKPFSYERFLQAVTKAKRALSDRPAEAGGFLNIKADRQWYRIPHDDILYIEGWKEYVKIITPEQKIVALAGLTRLEKELPAEGFLRVHKSYIVGRRHVRHFDGEVLLVGETRIPVARARKKAVEDALFR
ncbi:MAG: LytTR family DNA-binding domain-containing protein [Saprospiraceae bacterium]|nr:LytTR family DNA-binding domain-containing protein [Saprospiraceae bacterium]